MASLAVIEKQIVKLVKQLDEKNQEILWDHLKHKFFIKHLNALVKEINENKKKYHISDEDIEKEVSLARKEYHKNRR